MGKIELRKHIAADPSSVALLLTGPLVHEQEPAGDLQVVSADPAPGVAVSPPRRSGVGFAATVDVTADDGAIAHGGLTIVPASDAGCEVTLHAAAESEAVVRSATRHSRRFLESLDQRARSRAYAA